MFITKTELLVSLLFVTLSFSAAAVVPTEGPVPNVPEVPQVPEVAEVPQVAEVPLPAEAVAEVPEEEAELSVPVRSSSNCPPEWKQFKNSCYLMVNLSYSRINAEYLCENLGSSLASAHSYQDYHFLQQLTWKAGLTTAWIGGQRFQGYWRWDDGTAFDYQNWYNQGSSSDECIYLSSLGTQGWSADSCRDAHASICSFQLYC